MAKEWFVRIMGQEFGPMESTALRQLAQAHRISPGDEVRQGIAGQWMAAGEVQGLFAPAVTPPPVDPRLEQIALGVLGPPKAMTVQPPTYASAPQRTQPPRQFPVAAAVPQAAPRAIRPYPWIGILGVLLSSIGTFAPIASGPFGMSTNYFMNGKGDGVIVLVLAALSLVAIALKRYDGLWVSSVLISGMLAYAICNVTVRLNDAERAGASMFSGMIQLQWGWAVMYAGAIALAASAALWQASDDDDPTLRAAALTAAAVLIPSVFGAAIVFARQ